MKIDFEFYTPHGIYRDALHLPDDHTLTSDEIEAIKEQRRDNWIAVVTTSSVEEPIQDLIEINGTFYARVVDNG